MRIHVSYLPASWFLTPWFLVLATYAQTAAPTLSVVKTAPNYAGESFVIERAEARTVMAADGTGFLERSLTVKIQSDAALRDFGVLSVAFASASQKVEILYARVRRPDGTVIETAAADAMEQPEPVTREAPFYSDLKEKQLPIKSLRVGDTLEWKARIVRTKAEAPNQFWGEETFAAGAVVLSQTVELRVPKSVAVNVWTNPKANLKPVESDEGPDHIYRWETSSLEPTTGPEAEAAKEAKKKKLLTADEELDAREGALPAIAWSTFKSWAAVGAWYRSLETGRLVPDDQIKAKVAELTAGKSTEEEKVRAVYGFVAPQIRYIGVAFGIGRYQPHLASEVLDNQYGDCKDKHTLLAAMLTALGLHPDAVLIGEGIRFNPPVPSPAAFNHVITRVSVAGQPVWLDATAEVAPYRMLAYDLRDKSALLIPETGDARIERTPADLPFPTVQTWKAAGSLDKQGVSNSRITFTTRGDQELFFRAILRQVPAANYEELIQKISQSMGYGGTASHPSFSRAEDTADPLTWSYDYKREQGGDWEHFKIIPQVQYNSLPLVDEKEPPIQSIELGWPRTESSTAEMKIPDGWGTELPEAVHARSDFATLDETFRFDKGTIYTELKVTVLKQRLPATEWKTYKKWTEDAGLTNQVYLQLTRTKASISMAAPAGAGSTAPPPASTYNARAAKLIEQAMEAIDKRDFATASPLLDQARDLNPSQKDLWAALGGLSWLRHEMPDAIRDYQKELALHPDALWVYPNLANCQFIQRQRDEGLATLRTWAAAAADDPTPTVTLVNMYLGYEDATGALDAATRGIAALPEDRRNDPTLQLALGKAQIAAGSETKGAATLVALLKSTDDPLVLNDSAYELSKTFKELPLAESSERKALEKLGAESRAWTLDENPQTLLQKSSLLIASWDTLGWILFQQGKYQDAEDLVRASWVNNTHAEVGEHLGDIQDQLAQHQEAWKTFTLTLASTAGIAPKAPLTARAKRLKDKIDAQKRDGAKVEKFDATNALTQLRTVSLGPAADRNGAAEYILLLAHGRVERAQATGDKSINGGAELILKADVTRFIPSGSDTKLARQAILNCHSNTCDLIFEP